MIKLNNKIEEMLIREGATQIEYYMLINNDGFTFIWKDGNKHDLRHWRNVYGSDCDFWSCSIGIIKEKANQINKEA